MISKDVKVNKIYWVNDKGYSWGLCLVKVIQKDYVSFKGVVLSAEKTDNLFLPYYSVEGNGWHFCYEDVLKEAKDVEI